MVRSRAKAAHRGKPRQCLWLGPVTATADQRAIVSLRRAYLAELLRKAICDGEKLSVRALGLPRGRCANDLRFQCVAAHDDEYLQASLSDQRWGSHNSIAKHPQRNSSQGATDSFPTSRHDPRGRRPRLDGRCPSMVRILGRASPGYVGRGEAGYDGPMTADLSPLRVLLVTLTGMS